ncbi:Mycothiol acetyltransferase [Planctomycetes bacterium Pan216]|uniref:Mycothiol acetyltransferase n=2 Tax=Kolteria novifilia TaxID=2527975 RepID=A0A518B2H5_9BACT|nr:Mycothiol acetyltransferase [Planctomycetes bacterium Pan216]
MVVTYVKRYRMEIDLSELPPLIDLPEGYYWVAWHRAMLDHHARVKFRCFHDELDARIFPCLGQEDGCQRLMREISSRKGFIPQATWLLGDSVGYVGTVQGVADRTGTGMIQNLGVVPEARGRGLGAALLLKSLHGFRSVNLRMGSLEVTAENRGALSLYRKIGFRRSRTLYKAIQEG